MKTCNIKHRNDNSRNNCYICGKEKKQVIKKSNDYAKKIKTEKRNALNKFKKDISKNGLTAKSLNDVLQHGGLTKTGNSNQTHTYWGQDKNHVGYMDLIIDFNDSKDVDTEDFQGRTLAVTKELGEIRGETIDYDYNGSSPSFVFSIIDPITNERKYYRKYGEHSSFQTVWDEDKLRKGITANIFCNFIGNNDNYSLSEVKPKTKKRVIYETSYE